MVDRLPRRASLAAAVAAAFALAMYPGAATAGGFDFFASFDPFSVSDKVAQSPVQPVLPANEGYDPCQFGPLHSPVGVVEVVQRVLCHNPKSREVWANAKARAAELGVRESAYLPSVSATAGMGKQKSRTRYDQFPSLDSNVDPTYRNASLKLSLVLADFGLRSSYVMQARELLSAANETHDATLQGTFLDAAQAYYDTLSAIASLDAKKEAERAARESYMAANAMYRAGIGALTDKLQANTAYEQAKLERVQAEGALKNAEGNLAIAMGIKVDTPFTLAQPDDALPDTSFVKPVDQLIEEAREYHPGLRAAQAEIRAAQATVSATRAEGRPTLTLSTELSRNSQRHQLVSAGLPYTDNISATTGSIGIQLNVPIFEGFGRTYRVQAASHQLEAKQAEFARVEQQVTLEIWKSYHLLSVETEALSTTAELVDNARKSFKVARGRYKAGVGNIVELLNVQSALAKAEQQRIQAVSSWHTARLRLAASVGKIGLWAITGRAPTAIQAAR